MPHKPGNGAIFGIVSEDGLIKQDFPIYLYDMRRDQGVGKQRLLATQLSGADGGFVFAGLDPDYSDYMLVATDEDGVTPKNALVQDRVQPIAGHQGQGGITEWYINACELGVSGGFFTHQYEDDNGDGVTFQPFPVSGYEMKQSAEASRLHSWLPSTSTIEKMTNLSDLVTNPLGYAIVTGDCIIKPGGVTWEMILDFDEISAGDDTIWFTIVERAGWGWADVTSSTGSSDSRNWMRARLQITPAKQVQLLVPNPIHGEEEWDQTNGRMIVIGTFDLSAHSGQIHLVGVIEETVSCNVYVNGVAVGAPVVHGYSMFNYGTAGHPSRLAISNAAYANWGTNDPPGSYAANTRLGVTLRTPLMVYYNRPLSAAQVQAQYERLYTNNQQNRLSGYALEVAQDYPFVYYRMDDQVLTDTYPSLSQRLALWDEVTGKAFPLNRAYLGAGDVGVLSSEASPIAGRSSFSMLKSNGTANRFHCSMAPARVFPFGNQASVSAWLKFDTDKTTDDVIAELYLPSLVAISGNYNQPEYAQEALMASREWSMLSNYATTKYFELQRTTSNRFRLYFATTTGTLQVDFSTYDIPESQWLHVTFALDLTGATGEARLYVGTESVAPTLQETVVTGTPVLIRHAVSVNMLDYRYSARHRFFENFGGSMCEFAAFPRALSLARIQAHWGARGVV